MLESLKTQGDLHLARKLFHVVSIFAIFLCMAFLSPTQCWTIYFVAGVPSVLIDLFRHRFPMVNRVAVKILGPILRKHELRQLSGASYAIIGIGISYFVFPKLVSLLAVLFLAVGDPTASLFGVLFGKTKLIGKKSLEGSLACLTICSIASLVFFTCYNTPMASSITSPLLLLSLCCGLIAAISELVPFWGIDDNLVQPLLNGFLLNLLFWFWGGVIYV